MRIAFFLAAIICASNVHAQGSPGGVAEIGDGGPGSVPQEGLTPYLEYRKRIETAQNLAPLDNGLFGESTSLFNGSTSFRIVDIDLPGNNGIPVQFARQLGIELQPQSTGPAYDSRLGGMGNWSVEVPHVSATYPDSTGWYSTRCSGGSVPPLTLMGRFFHRTEYWHGISVYVPGRGGTSVLGAVVDAPKPTNGATYRLTTTERDYFDCIPMKSGLPGEGFRMTTAAGFKYYFDVATVRTAPQLQKTYLQHEWLRDFVYEISVLLPRKKYYLLASKIEDSFGNSVEFQYNANGHPVRIWSNDGREIQLNYADGRLATVTADGRVWSYTYSAGVDLDPALSLASVVLPDSSSWQYSYAGNLKPDLPPTGDGLALPWCRGNPTGVVQDYVLSALHPSGAAGQFNFSNTRHYRAGVHATECMRFVDQLNEDFTLLTPYYYDVMSLDRKSVVGPGVAERVWTYDYDKTIDSLWGTETQSPVYPCGTCAPSKLLVVTHPDGTKRRHTFGKVYRHNEGRLLGTEILDASGGVLRTETSEYLSDAEAPAQVFHGRYGVDLGGISDPTAANIRPVVSHTIEQQGKNFVWRVDKSCGTNGATYCFDSLARPTRVVRSSANSP